VKRKPKPKRLTLSAQLALAQDAYADALGDYVRARDEVQRLVAKNDELKGENAALMRQVVALNDTLTVERGRTIEAVDVAYVTPAKPWWRVW
jgi:cell division protein FtsB